MIPNQSADRPPVLKLAQFLAGVCDAWIDGANPMEHAAARAILAAMSLGENDTALMIVATMYLRDSAKTRDGLAALAPLLRTLPPEKRLRLDGIFQVAETN